MDRTSAQLEAVKRGAYVLKDCEGTPELIFIATGSEVELALKAADVLTAEGKKYVSFLCQALTVSIKQDAAYRESVLPAAVTKRVAIEAGIADFWYKYVGFEGSRGRYE